MRSDELFAAVRGRDVAKVKALLAAGADANAVRAYEMAGERASIPGTRSVLQEAAALGDVAIVEALLARGARLDERDAADGSTALLSAVRSGDEAMVRTLLAGGASPALVAAGGDDAFGEAVLRGHAAIEAALVQAGAKPTARLLELACHRGRLDLIARCEAAGLLRVDGEAMAAACRSGQVAVVDLLVQRGFDVRRDGVEPLCEAVNARQSAVVERLLEAGADVHGVNSYAWTPLHFAAWVGDLALVERLLAAGASPTALDGHGRGPASWAEEAGHAAVVARLRAAAGG